MSVDVRLPIGPPKPALLVAEQAIGADLDQKYVLVLNDKNSAEKRSVKLGTIFDGLRVIEEGLSASDRVIVVGKQNVLQPNAAIDAARGEDAGLRGRHWSRRSCRPRSSPWRGNRALQGAREELRIR